MAIDTATKRKNASQTISGLFGPGVTNDAFQGETWRRSVGWCYDPSSGGAPPPPAFVKWYHYRHNVGSGL
jgi:hypothetical protein